MKKLLLAAAVSLGLLSSASATIIGAGFGVNPTSAAGAFSNDPNGLGVGGVFFDQFLFQLVGPGFITVTTASNTFADGDINGPFGITNFTGAVYEIVGLPDLLPGGDDILRFGPQAATLCLSQLCQQLDGTGFLPSGNYYLALAGNAGVLAGYGGNLSTFAVPGPIVGAGIPGIMAMVGFGLLYRRRKLAQA